MATNPMPTPRATEHRRSITNFLPREMCGVLHERIEAIPHMGADSE